MFCRACRPFAPCPARMPGRHVNRKSAGRRGVNACHIMGAPAGRVAIIRPVWPGISRCARQVRNGPRRGRTAARPSFQGFGRQGLNGMRGGKGASVVKNGGADASCGKAVGYAAGKRKQDRPEAPGVQDKTNAACAAAAHGIDDNINKETHAQAGTCGWPIGRYPAAALRAFCRLRQTGETSAARARRPRRPSGNSGYRLRPHARRSAQAAGF